MTENLNNVPSHDAQLAVTKPAVAALRERLPTNLDVDADLLFDLAAGQIIGRYFGCRLASVFQPIVRLADRATLGYEAFVRSHHSQFGGLSPWNLFAQQAADGDLVRLDRLCRTLHTLNFFDQQHIAGDLYLNVHGRLLLAVLHDHGQAFQQILQSLQISPEQIVLELPQADIADYSMYATVTQNYHRYGFRVALNVRDARQIDPLRTLVQPDVIKIDAQFARITPSLREALDTAKLAGMVTIATHIENAARLQAWESTGVTAVQGHWLGVPYPQPKPYAQQSQLTSSAPSDFPYPLGLAS